MKVKITYPNGKVIEAGGDAEELAKLDLLEKKPDQRFTQYPGVDLIPKWGPPNPTSYRACVKPCNPECFACSGKPWLGIYPPPCICIGSVQVTCTTDSTQPYRFLAGLQGNTPNKDD